MNGEHVENIHIGAYVEQGNGEDESRIRRAARWCGKLTALGLIVAGSGAYGAFHEPAETSVGPHDASVDLTLDGMITVDMGPIGSIIKPMEDTHGVGAHISLGEVRRRKGGIDAEAYARSLANFEGDISEMKADLAGHAARYGLYGGAAALGLYALLGPRRREELADSFSTPGLKKSFAGLATAGVIGASLIATSTISNAESPGIAVDEVFTGTPLEGARVTGEFLPSLVNSYGREIIDLWKENDEFYDAVTANLHTAYTTGQRLQPKDGYPIMALYSDLHCNVGMARIIGEISRLSGADFIADGGDTTMGGTSYEKFCIQLLDGELPDIPRVVSGGNHDGPDTERQFRSFGFTPLNGEVEEVAGLHVLGDDDVMRSAFGTGIQLENDETSDLFSERLAAAACDETVDVDILLVHDPDAAEATLAQQCVGTVINGHMHNENIDIQTRTDGSTMLHLTADNASGALKQRPSLGPVESPATVYLMKFNGQTGLAMFYQTVTILPDASVELGEVVTIPQPLPPLE